MAAFTGKGGRAHVGGGAGGGPSASCGMLRRYRTALDDIERERACTTGGPCGTFDMLVCEAVVMVASGSGLIEVRPRPVSTLPPARDMAVAW